MTHTLRRKIKSRYPARTREIQFRSLSSRCKMLSFFFPFFFFLITIDDVKRFLSFVLRSKYNIRLWPRIYSFLSRFYLLATRKMAVCAKNILACVLISQLGKLFFSLLIYLRSSYRTVRVLVSFLTAATFQHLAHFLVKPSRRWIITFVTYICTLPTPIRFRRPVNGLRSFWFSLIPSFTAHI